jgi:16S rRNA (uracil1498-N3)-methyltransferase
MQPPLFYAPPTNREGEIITLPSDEARHAAKVLRLERGAIVILVDGGGNACRGEVASLSARKVTVRAHSDIRDFGEPAVRLTLAAGLSVGFKFDSVVQRGTELGVSRFVPLLTEKSRVTIDDPKRARTKVNRWGKVALASMKQCRRSFLPEIATPTKFESFLEQLDPADPALIFHPGDKATGINEIAFPEPTRRISLLVGPESGFSEDEMRLATDAGLTVVNLGRRVLRTETAGPTVVALVMARLGEFR